LKRFKQPLVTFDGTFKIKYAADENHLDAANMVISNDRLSFYQKLSKLINLGFAPNKNFMSYLKANYEPWQVNILTQKSALIDETNVTPVALCNFVEKMSLGFTFDCYHLCSQWKKEAGNLWTEYTELEFESYQQGENYIADLENIDLHQQKIILSKKLPYRRLKSQRNIDAIPLIIKHCTLTTGEFSKQRDVEKIIRYMHKAVDETYIAPDVDDRLDFDFDEFDLDNIA
jgi:hypothetical protein